MATRRIPNIEKDVLGKVDINASSSPDKLSTAAVVPKSVVAKLLLFTLAMVVAPLGSYYITLNTIFKGSNTLAGATAAVVANVVLIAYVIVAVMEDNAENENEKKSQ
ncbi:vacuolar ATPase assembly integral membrane protein vma21 [Maublancomyces gigas]|uniref:Vacuolar ATPase assembly integral membrane protein vma21 n=1 Tax=Discina gigas TaxID=1032678 RepID=A0ABR3GUP0_9PEZI